MSPVFGMAYTLPANGFVENARVENWLSLSLIIAYRGQPDVHSEADDVLP